MSVWAKRLGEQQDALKQNKLWRERRLLCSPQSSKIQIDGCPQGLLNFSSNDYLGLANDSDVVDFTCEMASKWGAGSGASHLVSGHLEVHHQLEQKLADFVQAESAVLFSGGYMANIGLPSALLSSGSNVYQDKLNHASLIDGALLAKAKAKIRFQRYRHADVEHLKALMASNGDDGLNMIVTDGVFSMDGDVAPLAELAHTAAEHQALLVVDDAHGLGVIGPNGRGALAAAGLGVTGDTLFMGTLGKALGSFGAFVAGDKVFIQHLVQKARSYIYTTALPPAAVAASLAALDKLKHNGDQLRACLNARIAQFKLGVAELGLQLMPSESAIQPLIVGDEDAALNLSDYLLERGVFVPAIRPPTVPVNTSRLRFTFSAAHSESDVSYLLDALVQAQRVGLLLRNSC
jgi:8-amino-7-oxononanoate synthase